MEENQVQPERLIDLGTASEQTLGADGRSIDFVGMRDSCGISQD